MKAYLEVKIASLAAEARIIRKKERTARSQARWLKKSGNPQSETFYQLHYELHQHRTSDVRNEARAAHLALGYMKGRAYNTMEAKCYLPPNWMRVAELVAKYGGNFGMERKALALELQEWSQGKRSLFIRELARV